MTDPVDRLRRFLRELKRRNVYRVAVTYAVVAFAVWQAANLLFPALDFPGWTVDFVIVFTLLGFPIAIVVAWAFEMTPEGMQRTPDAASLQSGSGTEGGPSTEQEASVVSLTTGLAGVLAVLSVATGWWYLRPFSNGQGESASERSVAVLPFDDLSAGSREAGIGVGLTETIIAQLSLVEDLSVVSRTSVMRFQDSSLPLPAIADSLGVEHVVEGSVQRSGDNVRIVAQLIRADTDRHLWAHTFDRPFSDIFRVQSEVATRVADALQAELTANTRKRIEEKPTDSPAAYDLYLRGVQLSDRSRSDNRAAVALLRQAIGMDSTFALAYAGLANAYMHRAQDFGYPYAWYDSALAAARRAVEIDPDLARAHKEEATALLNSGRVQEGIGSFRRAIALRPGYSEAMHNLGIAYAFRGRVADAIRWVWRSLPSMPNSPYPLQTMSVYLYLLGEDEAAEAWAERLLEVGGARFEQWALSMDFGRGRIEAAREHLERLREWNADAASTLKWTGILAQLDDRPEAAIRSYRRGQERRPDFRGLGISPRLRLAQALQAVGREEEADTLLGEAERWNRSLIERGNELSDPRLRLAAVRLLQGDREGSYRWLDSAYAAGYRLQPLARHDPIWRRIREERRFQKLLGRMEKDLGRQRAEVRSWAQEKGIDWPPMPEFSRQPKRQ